MRVFVKKFKQRKIKPRIRMFGKMPKSMRALVLNLNKSRLIKWVSKIEDNMWFVRLTMQRPGYPITIQLMIPKRKMHYVHFREVGIYSKGCQNIIGESLPYCLAITNISDHERVFGLTRENQRLIKLLRTRCPRVKFLNIPGLVLTEKYAKSRQIIRDLFMMLSRTSVYACIKYWADILYKQQFDEQIRTLQIINEEIVFDKKFDNQIYNDNLLKRLSKSEKIENTYRRNPTRARPTMTTTQQYNNSNSTISKHRR